MNTRNTINPAAALTYIDFLFKYVASFLYFADNIDKFCVFVSSSDKTAPLAKTSSIFWTCNKISDKIKQQTTNT
uniref:CSON003649 protein n=1 Tax=Culicoides sonorensis TaxID=179676 RepID=A0A336MRP2_CULSO